MNLKKGLSLTAGIIASINAPVVVADKGLCLTAGIIASINVPVVVADELALDPVALIQTALTEFLESSGSLVPLLFDSIGEIFEIVTTNGIDFQAILAVVSDLVVNVIAQVASSVGNVLFEALTPQINELIQGLLTPFDPIESIDFFGKEWKKILNYTAEGDCVYEYQLMGAEVSGFSEANIVELKLNEQDYNDGKFKANLFVEFGSMDVKVDFNGKTKGSEDCSVSEEEFFFATYTRSDATLSMTVDIEANVEGQVFNVTYVEFQEVNFKTNDPITVADSKLPAAAVIELQNSLEEEIAVVSDLLETEDPNVTELNEFFAEFASLPYSVDLPFDWPL